MADTTASLLAAWSNFYVMAGSAAASLTGLMFVVITLVGRTTRRPGGEDGIRTFSTPTVMHFAAALLVSAVLSAPWRTLVEPGVLLGLAGLGGVAYILRIMYRTSRLSIYRADPEDWTWYNILPFLSYAAIFVTAFVLRSAPVQALFGFAAAVVLLIFIGIHNAWDTVTYIASGRADEPPSAEPSHEDGNKR
jgi:hypothetical protein